MYKLFLVTKAINTKWHACYLIKKDQNMWPYDAKNKLASYSHTQHTPKAFIIRIPQTTAFSKRDTTTNLRLRVHHSNLPKVHAWTFHRLDLKHPSQLLQNLRQINLSLIVSMRINVWWMRSLAGRFTERNLILSTKPSLWIKSDKSLCASPTRLTSDVPSCIT